MKQVIVPNYITYSWGFRAWINGKDDQEVVGFVGVASDCPVARYWAAMSGHSYSVAPTIYAVNDQMHQVSESPLWVHDVVTNIDRNGRVNKSSSVSALTVKHILQTIKPTMEEVVYKLVRREEVMHHSAHANYYIDRVMTLNRTGQYDTNYRVVVVDGAGMRDLVETKNMTDAAQSFIDALPWASW